MIEKLDKIFFFPSSKSLFIQHFYLLLLKDNRNIFKRAFEALSYSTHLFGRRLVLEWAQPEQNQDVELLRQKESQISGKY